MTKLFDLLGKEMLFFDGAMGTMLQAMGMAPGEFPESWNLSRPEDIKGIHKAYLDAGCHILKTNTFGANRVKMAEAGLSVKEVVNAGVFIAKEAAKGYENRLVALDIGPTGKLMEPLGELSFADAYEAFKEMAVAGEKAGADLCLIETMSDTYEAKAAVLAVKENTSLPVFVTMIFDEQGKLLTGGDIPAAVAMLEGLRVDALGFNCGAGPEQMKKLLPQLLACTSLPVIVNPNAGLPVSVNGRTVFNVGPVEFAGQMEAIGEMGAWILGGCCGTTPEHLRETVNRCGRLVPKPLPEPCRTVVSSYARAVELGEEPVIVGERINPTGKKRFKEALRENDLDYILREGIAQQQNGAHILDVNVGLPEIDESAVMAAVVPKLQGVVDLPLQIDTTNIEAMERALRLYNGKAMVNSVNGKLESMEAVFPLVQKYGGVVVALTIDEEGIPETAEGRLAIAKKIVETAEGYGIHRRDIVVDALTMTISSEADAALTTLRAMELIKKELGVKTILGVSNVSFGLPRREIVNSAFYLLAMERGLDAAIINPNSEAMMESYFAFRALAAKDPQCGGYIARYGGQESAPKTQTAGRLSLHDAIVKGLKEDAYEGAKERVQKKEPLSVINEELIPALDVVGQGFEKGTIFLPQLLMSAEAAKAAFEAVKEKMGSNSEAKKGKVILATVKGDIHDIGKNIVKVLLDNYGFQVIDLGKDVEPQLIVDTAMKEDVKLVGLSALMTTTVPSMEETIRLLRTQKPDCKVMVGGAVMTEEYAEMIGADHYSKDAMGSVHYAQAILC